MKAVWDPEESEAAKGQPLQGAEGGTPVLEEGGGRCHPASRQSNSTM